MGRPPLYTTFTERRTANLINSICKEQRRIKKRIAIQISQLMESEQEKQKLIQSLNGKYQQKTACPLWEDIPKEKTDEIHN